jgi:hypothetical protein
MAADLTRRSLLAAFAALAGEQALGPAKYLNPAAPSRALLSPASIAALKDIFRSACNILRMGGDPVWVRVADLYTEILDKKISYDDGLRQIHFLEKLKRSPTCKDMAETLAKDPAKLEAMDMLVKAVFGNTLYGKMNQSGYRTEKACALKKAFLDPDAHTLRLEVEEKDESQTARLHVYEAALDSGSAAAAHNYYVMAQKPRAVPQFSLAGRAGTEPQSDIIEETHTVSFGEVAARFQAFFRKAAPEPVNALRPRVPDRAAMPG